MKFLFQGKKWLLSIIILMGLTPLSAQEDGYGYNYNTDTLFIPVKKKPIVRPWPSSQFSIRLGGFVAVNNMDLGAGTNNNPHSIINFENGLGATRNTYSALLNFNMRFRRHNRIDFSYYNIYRSATKALDKDIQFGDHTYPIDSDIKFYINTNIFRLSYGYSFISNKHLEVGALVGFHVMAFNMGMDFNGNTQQLSYKDDIKFTAPLPDFGLWGTYAINDRWAFSGEVSYFGVKINSIKGRILNAGLSAQYKINPHWGMDVGYTGFGVKINLDRKYLKSDFNWNYSGPYINLVYRFGHLY